MPPKRAPAGERQQAEPSAPAKVKADSAAKAAADAAKGKNAPPQRDAERQYIPPQPSKKSAVPQQQEQQQQQHQPTPPKQAQQEPPQRQRDQQPPSTEAKPPAASSSGKKGPKHPPTMRVVPKVKAVAGAKQGPYPPGHKRSGSQQQPAQASAPDKARSARLQKDMEERAEFAADEAALRDVIVAEEYGERDDYFQQCEMELMELEEMERREFEREQREREARTEELALRLQELHAITAGRLKNARKRQQVRQSIHDEVRAEMRREAKDSVDAMVLAKQVCKRVIEKERQHRKHIIQVLDEAIDSTEKLSETHSAQFNLTQSMSPTKPYKPPPRDRLIRRGPDGTYNELISSSLKLSPSDKQDPPLPPGAFLTEANSGDTDESQLSPSKSKTAFDIHEEEVRRRKRLEKERAKVQKKREFEEMMREAEERRLKEEEEMLKQLKELRAKLFVLEEEAARNAELQRLREIRWDYLKADKDVLYDRKSVAQALLERFEAEQKKVEEQEKQLLSIRSERSATGPEYYAKLKEHAKNFNRTMTEQQKALEEVKKKECVIRLPQIPSELRTKAMDRVRAERAERETARKQVYANAFAKKQSQLAYAQELRTKAKENKGGVVTVQED